MVDTDQLISALHQAADSDGSEREAGLRAVFDVAAPKIYGICLGVLQDEDRASGCLHSIFKTVFEEVDELAHTPEPVTSLFTLVCDHLATHASGHVRAPLFEYAWEDVEADPQALTFCLFEAGFMYGHSYQEIAAELELDPEDLKSRMRAAIAACYKEGTDALEAEFLEAAEFSCGLMTIEDVDGFIDRMAHSLQIQEYVRLWSADFVTMLEPFERQSVPAMVKDRILSSDGEIEAAYPVQHAVVESDPAEAWAGDLDEDEIDEPEYEDADEYIPPPRRRVVQDEEPTPRRKRTGLIIFLLVGVLMVGLSLALVLFGPQLQRWAEALLGPAQEEQSIEANRYFYFAAQGGDVEWRGSLSADGTLLEFSARAGASSAGDLWLAVGQQAPMRLVEGVTDGQTVRLPPELGEQLPFAILVLAPPINGNEPDLAQAKYAALVDEALYAWE